MTLHARLVIMAEDFARKVARLALEDLARGEPRGESVNDIARTLVERGVPLDDVTRAMLEAALRAGGNQSQAARMLGVPRKVFLRRARRLSVPVDRR